MPAQPLRRITTIATLAAALTPAAAAEAAPGDTTLVSHQGGTPSSAHVYSPVISGDGTAVAFSSRATNLSTLDQDDTIDVFAHALGPGTTGLVSARPPAVVGPDIAADFDAASATISGDGRYVAFESRAINLHDDDQDNTVDVYRRDLVTGAVELVSRASSGIGGAAADDDSGEPSISADGRLVAFSSRATNLSSSDDDPTRDVFVRDMETDTTYFASRVGGNGGDDDSRRPRISADGSTVVFVSDATDLTGFDDDATTDVFAHTLATGATQFLSRQPAALGGAGQNDDAGVSEAVAVSADGRHVAFTTKATNLTPEHGPVLDVVVRDRIADTVTLASRADGPAGAAGNAASFQPSISADGTKVAFHTYATNMHAEDTDFAGDVYVRDLAAATTTLASRQSLSLGGAKGDDATFNASLSADGTKVAYTSYADNYANVAGYGSAQAFVHELGGQPPASAGGGTPAPAAPASTPGTASAPAAATPLTPSRTSRPRTRLAFRPGSSRCIRRGRIVMRLKVHRGPRGSKVIRANVRAGKAKTKRLRGTKARRIVLRGLKTKRVTVRITARTSTGALLKRTRTYRTCR